MVFMVNFNLRSFEPYLYIEYVIMTIIITS